MTTSREVLVGRIPYESMHLAQPHRIAQVSLDTINTCSQHRNGSNPVQDTLNKSVAERGLINPLTVAILSEEDTREYIDFTNKVWGSGVSIDDFEPSQHSEHGYMVLIAGHSRLLACQNHAKNLGIAESHYFENVRILPDVSTVDEIIAWQTEENVHSAPPPQNFAKVLAESWFWLKHKEENGAPIISQKVFARQHGVSDRVLRDALNYVALPQSIRGLTDEGILPYSVAVEMGRARSVLERRALQVASENPEALIETDLLILAHKFIESGKILVTRQAIRSKVQDIKDSMDDTKKQRLEGFMQLLDEPSELEQAQAYLRQLLRVSSDMINLQSARLYQAIVRLAGMTELSIDLDEFQKRREKAAQALGNISAQ